MAPKKTLPQLTDRHAFLLTVEETARQLSTNIESGLTSSQVAELQKTHPPNELDTGDGASWYKILGKQVSNAMILVSSRIETWEGGCANHITILGPHICNGSELWSWRLH